MALRRATTKEMTLMSKAQAAAYQYILMETEPVFSNGSESSGKLSELPLTHISELKGNTPSFTHMLETFHGLDVKPDLSILCEQSRDDLEPPLGFNGALVNVDVQYYVVRDEESIDQWVL
eukprot:158849-Amphidinium_carterae.1